MVRLQLCSCFTRCLAQPRQWTTSLVGRTLQLCLSERTIRRRLREVDTGRRPQSIFKGDPEAKQRRAKVRKATAAIPASAMVFAEDECHLDLLSWVRLTGIAQGQRQRILTLAQNQRCTRFGAIDIGRANWMWTVT